MTREETKKIIAVIATSYPNYKPDDFAMTIDVWTELLTGYPYSDASNALKAYIMTDTSGFAPSIGQIIEKINARDEMEDLKAWALVRKAIRNGNYGSEEEFANLPQDVQRAVGDKQNISAWANIPTEEIETVIQSQFLRAYRALKTRENEERKLNPQITERPQGRIEG